MDVVGGLEPGDGGVAGGGQRGVRDPVGEGGGIGAPAAIINAVNDALKPFGVSIDEIPATPQRIRAALRAAAETRS